MADETPVAPPEEKKPKRKSSFDAFRSPRVIPPLESPVENSKADSLPETKVSPVESPAETSPVEIPAQKILEPTISVTPRAEPTTPVRPSVPQLRHHEEEPVDSPISPIKITDPRPPQGAAWRPLSSKGIRTMATASDDMPPPARHRPAPYEPPPTPSVGAMDAETLPHITSRVPLPRTEYSGGKPVRRGDPIIQAMDEAFAAFGPEEHVVDIRVEVFDEATRQYWEIGTAIAQPMSVAKIPASYLKFAGLYRVTVGPSGEGFPPRRSRPFTVRILGPQRPTNWFFDESDIGGTVYGERGGNFMGYANQPIVPPQGVAQNPVGAAVQSVRELKDLKKLLSDEDDDGGGGGSRRFVELEQELRMARMQGGLGGWGGGPPPYIRQKEEEERRRREEDDRRRAEEERRRVEEIERKRLVDEERRRSDDEKRRGEEERRRIEDERRHTEAEARRREMQDLQTKFDLQMTEVQRQAEDTRRRADEAERKASERERDLVTQKEREDERRRYEETRRLEEDRRREEKDRWETQQRSDKERWEEQRREDRQRTEVQLAEIRKQSDVLAAKLAEAPKETPFDKLLSNLPATLIQAKDLFAGNRTEALAAQQQAREDSRLERERIRDEANQRFQTLDMMSKMNVESIKAQAAQSQEHMRSLMEFVSKGNNNNAMFDSVAGLMKTQTEVFSTVARMNLTAGGGTPSPWVEVAAGAIEAAGNLATSVIAAKMGASPEAIKQMMGLSGGEEPVAPPVRRPPLPAGPPRQVLPRPSAPVAAQPKPVVIPRAPAPARTPVVAQPAVRKPTAPVQPAQGPQVEVPGIPKKIMNRVLFAAQQGEPPAVVARKLFNLVDLCDAHELHKGNADAEKIMKGLTVEVLIPNEIKRFFAMTGVVDEEYLAAITFVYLKLIYANVETLRKIEQGEPEAEQAAPAEAEAEAEPAQEPIEQEATEPVEQEAAERPSAEPVEAALESEAEQAAEEPVAEAAPEAEVASEPEASPDPPKPKVRLVSRRIVKPTEVKE